MVVNGGERGRGEGEKEPHSSESLHLFMQSTAQDVADVKGVSRDVPADCDEKGGRRRGKRRGAGHEELRSSEIYAAHSGECVWGS